MNVRFAFHTPDGITKYEGVLAPNRLIISAEGPDLPYDIELEAVLEAGRMVIRSVGATSRDREEITSEGLRRLPLARILRSALMNYLGTFSVLMGRDLPALGRSGPNPEVLEVVAAAYRIAYLLRDPPTAMVATLFNLPRSTAARWVQRARREGFLGPAEQRKGGERPPKRRKRPSRSIERRVSR
jgi:hypothetical protein